MARHSLRHRCSVCDAVETRVAPDFEPLPDWERLRCIVATEERPVSLWLCPSCAEIPESRAFVALRNPIIVRFLPNQDQQKLARARRALTGKTHGETQ